MKPTRADVKFETKRAAMAALYRAHPGGLDPQHIVDAARSDKHALHDEFEWDDGEAAELYRLSQAGALIRRIKVTIVKEEPKTKQIVAQIKRRKYESQPSKRRSPDGGGSYRTLEDILNDEKARAELLADVLRQLQSYRERYAALTELAEVWAAIADAQPATKRSTRETRHAAAPRA